MRGKVLDVGCGGGALAALIAPANYLGVDVDEDVLATARRIHPHHRFSASLPTTGDAFDTVVALAVIEHVDRPASFLRMLESFLHPSPESRIVLTTPHPLLGWVHTMGASVGVFSRHSSEEHKDLLGRRRLAATAADSGLRVMLYRRFLLGANQLAVLRR